MQVCSGQQLFLREVLRASRYLTHFLRVCVVCSVGFVCSAQLPSSTLNDKVSLARAYVEQNLVDKAMDAYETLLESEQYASIPIHREYLLLLEEHRRHARGLKYLKKAIKHRDELSFWVDKMYFENLLGEEKRLLRTKKLLFKRLGERKYLVSSIGQYLSERRFVQEAVELYVEARKWQKREDLYALDLGLSYVKLQERDKALRELMSYAAEDVDGHMSEVEGILAPLVEEDAEWRLLISRLFSGLDLSKRGKNRLMLRLFSRLANLGNEKIRSQTRVMFYFAAWSNREMGNFENMIFWATVGHKRGFYEMDKVVELGIDMFDTKEYAASKALFKYVRGAKAGSSYDETANYYLLRVKEALLLQTYPVKEAQLNNLIEEYEEFARLQGMSRRGVEGMRRQIQLLVFYKKDLERAKRKIEKLRQHSRVSSRDKGYFQLCLCDIFLMEEAPWSAILCYLQVEKNYEMYSDLVEEAKLKNMQTTYYQGEFSLARQQAGVLKKATTKEMANDALDMSHFLRPYAEDSLSEQTLRQYTRAELCLRKRDFVCAENELLALKEGEKLGEIVSYRLAQLYHTTQRWEEALHVLESLSSDKAAFLCLEILDLLGRKEEWRSQSRKFVLEHRESVYLPQVRRRLLSSQRQP